MVELINMELIWASKQGDVTQVKLLLDAGANVNIKNNWGDTALGWAERKGYTEIIELLKKEED